MDHFVFLCLISHAFASVLSCLVVSYWVRADVLALIGDVYCILGQVWYLIVLYRFLIFAIFLTLKLSLYTYYCPKS